MPLSKDEKAYFDEKFKNLEGKVDAALKFGGRINDLEVEMGKRPTINQLLAACTATASLATIITSLILKIV